ncbi:MAG TPA: hypothetical protein VEC57_15600 [Candidatus Limnocylindrales bacterium]|nr:hypothetical protein [Candidatus Limnocylindrales bacterium]
MAIVQQPVQDRGGQHLVAGQDLRPLANPLVRRDQDAAALVAVGHQAKEQAGLLARHRIEADLVDDQQR